MQYLRIPVFILQQKYSKTEVRFITNVSFSFTVLNELDEHDWTESIAQIALIE